MGMASEYEPIETATSKARPLRTLLIVALVAFLIGLVAMGAVLRKWGGGMGYFGREAAAPADRATAPSASTMPALSSQVQPLPAGPANLDDLTTRVRDLEQRLAQISVTARAASGNASRAEGLLVAFAARRALDRGVALGYIEGQLRERFGEAQPRAVAMVIAAARQPVTLEELQIALNDLGPQLASAGSTPNWWDGVKRELSGLIVVRRAGTPSPLPTERLQRAKRRLEGGQVDAALAEVARMPGRDKAANWMANARRYIEARRALDIIETAAILDRPDDGTPFAAPPPAPTQDAPLPSAS
jgi:hypothetical protein